MASRPSHPQPRQMALPSPSGDIRKSSLYQKGNLNGGSNAGKFRAPGRNGDLSSWRGQSSCFGKRKEAGVEGWGAYQKGLGFWTKNSEPHWTSYEEPQGS